MRLCMGCMAELNDDQIICPYCGYEKDTPVEEAYYLLPETKLGDRYLVGKVLGYGGFGVTYIGRDLVLNRVIAIKEYFPSDYATRSFGSKKVTVYSGDAYEEFKLGLSSFISEAKRLAQLHYVEGVVRIYDCVQENDTGYIIMEYLNGQTVKEILETKKRYSYVEAEKLIINVLNTLEEVHKAGIIHRDIAPDNIFITTEGEEKLLDFGAARYAASAQSRSLSVILKPGYAPEEQYRSHGEQGPWTDVYGVGATFYRMITGVPPEESVERMIKDHLEPPSEIGVEIPAEKEQALLKSLNVRKDNRFQTAEEFKNALLIEPKVKKDKNRYLMLIVPLLVLGICMSLFLVKNSNQREKKGTEQTSAVTAKIETEMQSEESAKIVKETGEKDEAYVQSENKSGKKSEVMSVSEMESEEENVSETESETEEISETRREIDQINVTESGEEYVSKTENGTERQSEIETESSTEKQSEMESETEIGQEISEKDETSGSYIVTENTSLKEEDSVEADTLLEEISRGAYVYVIKTNENNQWRKVRYLDMEGWISAGSLTLFTSEDYSIQKGEICYVNTAPGNDSVFELKEKPQVNSETLKTMAYGTELIVEEIQDGWGKTSYDGQNGWVDLKQVSTYIPGGYYYVTANTGLHMRSEPDTGASDVGTLHIGNTVKAEAFEKGWIKVTYNDKTGWLALKYMTPCQDAEGGKQFETELPVQNSSGAGTGNYSGGSYVNSGNSGGGVKISSGW